MQASAASGEEMEFIYCGGRFDFDYLDEGFRERAEKDYRAVLLKDVNKLLCPSDTVMLSDSLAYAGPFYFETDGMQDRNIVEIEKKQIERCTDAVFLLDHSPCPGTIAEMVYAASLQKKIHIFYVKDKNETESLLHSPFWYPMILCSLIDPADIEMTSCASRSEACERIIRWMKDSF